MNCKPISLFSLLTLLPAALAAAFSPTRAQITLAGGLTAFWQMDELAGPRSDSLGASPLAPAGSVAAIPSKHTNAAQLAATSSLSTPDSPALSIANGNFTLAGWVQFNGIAPASSLIPGKANEYALEVVNGQWRFTAYGPAGAPVAQAISLYSPPLADSWYFAAWHDADANQTGILINNVANVVSTTSDAADTASPFTLGSATHTLTVDTLGIWRRVRTRRRSCKSYRNSLPPILKTLETLRLPLGPLDGGTPAPGF